MSLVKSLSDRFAETYLNGRWICGTNVTELINSVSYREAVKSLHDLNSIALLTFHLSYYLGGVLQVLNGGKLDISDSKSFDMSEMSNDAQWKLLCSQLTDRATQVLRKIELMNQEELHGDFSEGKYGSNLRNIEGLIEHGCYHLGQMVVIRKMTLKQDEISG
jgi:uncharacterized damage-inducible protein DinB